MNILFQARAFAVAAHDAVQHKRKYTNEPYWQHCCNVAQIVYDTSGTTFEMVAAAWLHDVLEDTPIAYSTIHSEFGIDVARMVIQLTDIYTTDAYPSWNRAERKHRENMRLGKVSNEAKTIKLADLIDNTATIVEYDPGFAKTYMREKRELLPFLRGGDETLWNKANETTEAYFKSVGQASA